MRLLPAVVIALLTVASIQTSGQERETTNTSGPGAPKPSAKAAATELSVTLRGDVNAVDASGTTPLHRAAQANDATAVERLIRAGANINASNRYGVTPLSVAAKSGSGAMVDGLLNAGADPNATSGEGETALMTAARSGNAAAITSLLEHGADPNAREQWLGQTALMWAAAENHAGLVSLLLAHGAEVNASGSVLEHWAMMPSENATPRVNMPKGGMSALHHAARQGALDVIKVLAVAPGIDLDQTDPDGVNALLYATLNGHYDVAAYLLEKGANPNLADQFGRTVLYAAVDMHRQEWDPRPSPKHDTIERVHALDVVKLALAKGASVAAPITNRLPNRCAQGCQSPGPEGATPLWRAAKGGDVDVVQLLLAAGADPMMPAARDGSTPAMVAAGHLWKADRTATTESESLETLKVLLDAGVDVNAGNTNGETALHSAASRGADTIVQFLVDRGARLDARDKANRTPLDAAMGVPSPGARPQDYNRPEPRESTANLLRELMTARGIAIEPYTKPEKAPTEQ